MKERCPGRVWAVPTMGAPPGRRLGESPCGASATEEKPSRRQPGRRDAAHHLPVGLSGPPRRSAATKWWGGQQLSAGQWQRFAVARSFFRSTRSPGLLILDEPTSALDPRAEHRIFKNLRALAADRAVLLVTHNLSNVVVADRIVVMAEGRIVQEGTWAQLSQQPGLFRELLALRQDRTVPGQRASAVS
ncbi:ABC-type glutathione transport system ATPase component [Kitasatospora sp. MAP5-34]|nr:ABC-type glutathione transport system ATPase component [Kitasatospora sp. MAP5-34]